MLCNYTSIKMLKNWEKKKKREKAEKCCTNEGTN